MVAAMGLIFHTKVTIFSRIASGRFISKLYYHFINGWALVGITFGVMTGLAITGCREALHFGCIIWAFSIS